MYGGKQFNAPNDAVVHPDDGSVWFTDPGYGSLGNYEGHKADTGSVQPIQKEAVYRIDAQSGKVDKVTDEIFKPNGLCFSPDYKKLYVADTGASHYPEAPKNMKVWDVVGKRLRNGKEFASMEYEGRAGLADGIRADIDGNIWASAGWVGDGYDGVHIFAPNGDRIGQIRLAVGSGTRYGLLGAFSHQVSAVSLDKRKAGSLVILPFFYPNWPLKPDG
jgi:gluconolactonase